MIRRATADDIEAIVQLRESYCAQLEAIHGVLAPHDPDSTRKLCTVYLGKVDAAVFVAETDGLVVGILMLLIGPYPMNMAVPMAIQATYYVEPVARGNGLGGALLEAGEAWSRSKRAAFSIASFRVGLDTEGFYEARGYTSLERTFVKRLL